MMTTATIETSIELSDWDQTPVGAQGGAPTSSSARIINASNEPADTIIQQLEPADGGLAAWRLLIAAFVFEALLWGFPISFGVFQNYYSTMPEFAGNSNIALIGTISQGSAYLGAPLSAVITKRFPKYQRLQIFIGWPLCIGGLAAGSFTSSLGGLIATQGVMYGVGFVILTYPIVSMVNEWWIVRKGMAFGIISSASGASGVVMPFIIQALLSKFGYKTTLRAIAVGMVVLTAPLLPLLKARLPAAEQSTIARTNWSFVKKPLFWIYCISTMLQGLGFFFPALYLPSYATALGLSSTGGALILAVMSVFQVLGQFAFGYMSDKNMSVSALATTCSIMATVATFALWGTAKSLSLLIVFSVTFGFFGYGYTTMRVGMGRAVADDGSSVFASYIILIFLQGVGNILAGPISSALIVEGVYLHTYAIGKYESLVIFTGLCMFSSAFVIGMWYLMPRKIRTAEVFRTVSR